MVARIVGADRDTPMLPPPDLREWVPAEDLVHFVLEAVAGMKLPKLKINRRRRSFPPRNANAFMRNASTPSNRSS